ncbi:failed axon connections homolog [Penaeus japonicus]|uniref:failed axon connections homolog n=1 Tax=Penaeus japonicus TaxID=27405 RepID=UPI001C717652|nr:failed axon connections homolog [Penaeus japonicus]
MSLVTQGGWTPVQIAGKALEWLWGRKKPIIVVVALVGVVKIRQHLKRKERRRKWNEAGKDVVVLHMFQRGLTCPSPSPSILKLETYLRIAEIPYQIDHEEPMGKKGKCPWITVNGEDVADSQLIMEYLGPKFRKDLSSHLTAEEKAVAHSMQIMVDEYFLWCLMVWSYVQERGRPLLKCVYIPVPFRFMIHMFAKRFEKATLVQGIGRHSFREVEEMGRKCLLSPLCSVGCLQTFPFSLFLTTSGQNPFMMGDKATELDCSVFGMLAQVMWCSPNSAYLRMLESDYRNLYDYCIPYMKKFYPDWDKCLDKRRQ